MALAVGGVDQQRVGLAGDAEVGDLGPAVLGEQDVAGLHVAVHDAGGVGRRQRGRARRRRWLAPRARASGPARIRSASVSPGSRSITMNGPVVVGDARVEDGDHVGVLQAGGDPRLVLEPRLGVVEAVRRSGGRS